MQLGSMQGLNRGSEDSSRAWKSLDRMHMGMRPRRFRSLQYSAPRMVSGGTGNV